MSATVTKLPTANHDAALGTSFVADLEARVERLLEVVQPGQKVLICTHDNPDPDSIASAFALGRLLEARRKCEFVLTYGGVLGRAENKAMVRLLKIPLNHISRVAMKDYDVVGLVDTQPEVGNHALIKKNISEKVVLCIDHHPARKSFKDADFADVGGEFGATSTVLTAYLHVAGVEPDRILASALFYGLKSDTRDLGREVSPADVWAYSYLVPRTDMPLVSAIEHPRLPRDYFAVLVRAINTARVYQQEAVLCDLGQCYVPDLVPETADRLLQAQGIRWSIVVGEYKGEIYASIRVSDRRFSAGKMAREAVKGMEGASAGGHGSMAGARVPHSEKTQSTGAKTRARRKFLKKLASCAGLDPSGPGEKFTDSGQATEKQGSGKHASIKEVAPNS